MSRHGDRKTGRPGRRLFAAAMSALATLSLLAGGAGFWWAWIDRDRLTWHDRASGSRVVRVARPD